MHHASVPGARARVPRPRAGTRSHTRPIDSVCDRSKGSERIPEIINWVLFALPLYMTSCATRKILPTGPPLPWVHAA